MELLQSRMMTQQLSYLSLIMVEGIGALGWREGNLSTADTQIEKLATKYKDNLCDVICEKWHPTHPLFSLEDIK